MSTAIANAVAIPPHIWEQDHAIWKAWVLSTDVSFHTKQAYKRSITDLYNVVDRPIREITAQDIEAYAFALRVSGRSESTVRRSMTPIRAYWKFARTL